MSLAQPAQQHSPCPPRIRCGWVILGCVSCAGRGFPFPPRWQQPESPVLWQGVPALAAEPGSLAAGRVVAVIPRSAPGIIAQMGTWGNSHPSPGMVMSEEDSKTNGSLRSSAALQDFSSHQPLHQQRQHLSLSLSQPWRRSCQAAGAGAKINHVLNNVPGPSNGLSSVSLRVERGGRAGLEPWGTVHLGLGLGKRPCSARKESQGRCPHLGVPELPSSVGVPKLPSSVEVPRFVEVPEPPQLCRGPSRAGFCGFLSDLGKHFLLHSHLQFLRSCSSFMTFKKSCLVPFFQRCPVGSCPSQPSAGSDCLQLLCFLLLTVIGFDFLIAVSVFSVIFASCSYSSPLSLFLFPLPPFCFLFLSFFLPISFPVPFSLLHLFPFRAKLGDLLLSHSCFFSCRLSKFY